MDWKFIAWDMNFEGRLENLSDEEWTMIKYCWTLIIAMNSSDEYREFNTRIQQQARGGEESSHVDEERGPYDLRRPCLDQ